MAPWTEHHAALHQTLRDRQLLPQGASICVAVSGGQDSMCLAQLLVDLQPKWQWQLAIAHCDHRWRPDSAENAVFVQQQAQSWQLPCWTVTAEVIPTTEATARTWRYSSLTDLAQSHESAIVVTGHTASDRAETLLYNLVRGSGLDGLQALSWQRSLSPTVTLVRPLLAFTRTQTAAFCHQQQLPIWVDNTNEDLTHARNRLRLEVLPYLQQQFNPQVDRTLAQTAEILQAEVAFLEQEAARLYQQAIAPDTHRLHRAVLRSAPLALQRRVIRQLLQTVLPTAPEFEHIEKLVHLITAPNRTQTDPFPGGAIAYTAGEWIGWK